MQMSKAGTISINGQEYDAVSGLPVSGRSSEETSAPTEHEATPEPVKAERERQHKPAVGLHHQTQRSVTLNRKFTKRPAHGRTAITTHRAKQPTVATPVEQSPHVRKFAQHPVGVSKIMDIGPSTHPHVAKAHAQSALKARRQAAVNAKTHTPAATIKQQAITQAVANTAAPSLTKQHKRSFWQQRQRVTGVVAATFALVLLGGYFTYLNMPSLSVRVAAAQAGINAAYPDYRPDGYALSGPVTYTDGKVSMDFKANGSDAKFSVNQSKSSWNSDAVLDNYVTPRAGSSYMPYTERGLTIYTYDNNAAWVNGGILYTIEGDAPLSSEQIRRIATSLL